MCSSEQGGEREGGGGCPSLACVCVHVRESERSQLVEKCGVSGACMRVFACVRARVSERYLCERCTCARKAPRGGVGWGGGNKVKTTEWSLGGGGKGGKAVCADIQTRIAGAHRVLLRPGHDFAFSLP